MVETPQSGRPIDFSIMPSFRCNLKCWFCMYDAGPHNTETLDFDKTKAFVAGFDWTLINWFGFYGGEPSINMPLYDRFITLVPKDTAKFVITNGAWSLDHEQTTDFLYWCVQHHFHIIVSGTPEHVLAQNRPLLEALHADCPDGLELKKADDIHAQGRAKAHDWVPRDCGLACQRQDRNIRLGLRPDGRVVYQNCHGEYLTVQTYDEPFAGIKERAMAVRDKCWQEKRG